MSLLFPTHCILCGQTISEQARGLCKACRAQIETEMQTLTCYPPEYVSDLVCAAQYRGSYRAALLHIKYAHEPYRLYPIAELMAQAWDWHQIAAAGCDYLCADAWLAQISARIQSERGICQVSLRDVGRSVCSNAPTQAALAQASTAVRRTAAEKCSPLVCAQKRCGRTRRSAHFAG